MVEHAPLHTSTPGATGAEDGEKLLVEIDGRDRVVRLVGVDAPEPEGDNGEPECFFEESRDYLARMLKGRTVYLEKDQSNKDGKGRLMRYLWFVGKSDGKAYLVNERMDEHGYVIFKDEEDDERYEDRLRDAEGRAKAADAGLWGTCGGGHVRGGTILADPVAFEVVASESQDVARPRVVWRVVIEAALPPEVADATLAEAARQALDSDPNAVVAMVFGFRPGDDALGGGVYTGGKAEVSRDGNGWRGDGMTTIGTDGDVVVSVVTRVMDGIQVPAEETVMWFPRTT